MWDKWDKWHPVYILHHIPELNAGILTIKLLNTCSIKSPICKCIYIYIKIIWYRLYICMTYIRYPMLTFVQCFYATSPSCDQSYSKSAPWMMHLTLCSILQPQVTRYPMFAGLWQSGGCECGRNERIHHVRWFKSISIVQSNPCPVLLGIGSATFWKSCIATENHWLLAIQIIFR